MKRKRKITKRRFLLGFIVITLFLAVVRILFPSIAHDRKVVLCKTESDSTKVVETSDSVKVKSQSTPGQVQLSHFFRVDGSLKKNRIIGVRDYDESFPDSQSQQLEAALRYGCADEVSQHLPSFSARLTPAACSLVHPLSADYP